MNALRRLRSRTALSGSLVAMAPSAPAESRLFGEVLAALAADFDYRVLAYMAQRRGVAP